MKKLLMAAVVLGAVAVLIAGALWYLSQQPMYRPGMVRAGPPVTRPLQTHDESFWTMDSAARLYHFGDGAGPNVLVVHGGPGFPIRKPLSGLRPLAGRYRFQYYDQRGCGRSSRPVDRFPNGNYYQNMKQLDAALGLAVQVADIERVRQILGDPKIVLVGHSFGAFLAALYAAEYPEHVKALVLAAPANLLKMPGDDNLFQRMRAKLPANLKPEYDSFLARYLDFGGIFARSEEELARMSTRLGTYYVAAGGRVPEGMDAGDNGGWMVFAMYLSRGAGTTTVPPCRQ